MNTKILEAAKEAGLFTDVIRKVFTNDYIKGLEKFAELLKAGSEPVMWKCTESDFTTTDPYQYTHKEFIPLYTHPATVTSMQGDSEPTKSHQLHEIFNSIEECPPFLESDSFIVRNVKNMAYLINMLSREKVNDAIDALELIKANELYLKELGIYANSIGIDTNW